MRESRAASPLLLALLAPSPLLSFLFILSAAPVDSGHEAAKGPVLKPWFEVHDGRVREDAIAVIKLRYFGPEHLPWPINCQTDSHRDHRHRAVHLL